MKSDPITWGPIQWHEVRFNGMKSDPMAWSSIQWHEVRSSGMKFDSMAWSSIQWHEVRFNGMKSDQMKWKIWSDRMTYDPMTWKILSDRTMFDPMTKHRWSKGMKCDSMAFLSQFPLHRICVSLLILELTFGTRSKCHPIAFEYLFEMFQMFQKWCLLIGRETIG